MGAVVELVDQVLEAQHGAGDKVREDRHEGREVDQVARGRGVAAVHVDDVADRLEDVERDADRQQHMGEDEWLQPHRGHDRIEAVDAEVGVLEVAEDAQVDAHAEQQPALRGLGAHAGGADFQADPVVPQGDPGEQGEEVHPPPGVEDVAGNQQQQVAIAIPAHVVQAEENRQEQEQEHVGREDHPGSPSYAQHLGHSAPQTPHEMQGKPIPLWERRFADATCPAMASAGPTPLPIRASSRGKPAPNDLLLHFGFWVIDPRHIATQPEAVERLHVMLAL